MKLHRYGWNLKDEFNEGLMDYFISDDWIDGYNENISYFYYTLEAHELKHTDDFSDYTYEEAKAIFDEDTNEFMLELIKWQDALNKISHKSGKYDSFFKIIK
ncbi:hypothetical protein [Erwinia piriflorinigrans]|uniref:hypothetical protein n=1 Tax=Erwinia piriflorinigrans TaxID=665097 RepID=UPI0012EE5DBD|nr:hypothetical protein [Erwinia piriflorinigrans]